MKKLLITRSFQKNLKKYRKHFNEEDIINNVREFVRLGLRKGESKLRTEKLENITIVIVKLRISVRKSVGRYLLGIINDIEYLPIFIDLKTGIYGKNLGFKANKNVALMLEKSLESTLIDYIEHTENRPRLIKFQI